MSKGNLRTLIPRVRTACLLSKEEQAFPLSASTPGLLATTLSYNCFSQYLVSCTVGFLFPSGEGSTFLQEHAQIRMENKHTLPVRQSWEAVKWHFHLWNGGFLTGLQQTALFSLSSHMRVFLIVLRLSQLSWPRLPRLSPAPSLKLNLHFRLCVISLTSVWISGGRMKGDLYPRRVHWT